MKSRVFLAASGFPLTLLGAWVSLLLLLPILREAAGPYQCDPTACTTPTTRPLFVLALGALVTGLVMLALAATDMKTRTTLIAIGFPLSLSGTWASLVLLLYILRDRNGPALATTVPPFVLAVGVLTAGLVLLGWAARLKLLDVVHA